MPIAFPLMTNKGLGAQGGGPFVPPESTEALVEWAAAVKAGNFYPPVSSAWDTGTFTPAVVLGELQAGRRIVPFMRARYTDTEATNWTPDHTALAHYIRDNNLPFVIRVGNLESDHFIRDNQPYETSCLSWPFDASGGVWLGEIDLRDPIPALSGTNVGDFYNIWGSDNNSVPIGGTNPISVKRTDRLVATVPAAGDDGNQWIVARNWFSPMAPAGQYKLQVSDIWQTTFLDRLQAEIPNPNLVFWLSNNEGDELTRIVYDEEYRFTSAYPAVNTEALADYQLRELWPAVFNEIFDGIRDNGPAAWKDVTLFDAYAVDGAHPAGGIRHFHNTSDPTWSGTNYGTQAQYWDAGSKEMYYDATWADVAPRSHHCEEMYTVRSAEIARDDKAKWMPGGSFYASGGSAVWPALENGYGYIEPPRYTAYVHFMTFLAQLRLARNFTSNNRGLDTWNLPDDFIIGEGYADWAAVEAAFGISGRYTNRNYWDALVAAITRYHTNPILQASLTWELERQPVSPDFGPTLETIQNASITGPYNTEGANYLIPVNLNPAINLWDANTQPIWALYRSNAGTEGMIYAWSPQADALVTVTTQDGLFAVTARPAGSFWHWDGATVTEITS